MKENNEDGCSNSPSLQSGNIVILAADAALAAVRAHFAEQMEADYWETVRYQKAALKAALASLVDSQ
ncbi:TPA: hypothetical protein ACWL6U_004091 [Morganella morganii]|uniref:hypothetical protein n=1 Tax=Morganella morganii TaxID=582 RepID=UPI0023680AA8|nr:hypothetical protein [Morganella morganii]